MKEYKIVINNQEFIIKQDVDGKFIKPDFIKEYEKIGSALKPSFEPIIVARKPFKGSLVDNVIEHGVGGINIDECRVETTENIKVHNYTQNSGIYGKYSSNLEEHSTNQGRFPANTILTYDENDFDEVCGGFPNTKNKNTKGTYSGKNEPSKNINIGGGVITSFYNDSGSASRYFMNCKYTGKDEEFRRYIYTPKASKKDRDEGLDEFEEKNTMCDRNPELASANMPQNRSGNLRKNTHPTVKPTELMQYLVRLVTPNGGTVLDPFNGSGSTGKAVMYENKERNKNYKYIGIELTEEYLPIAKARIEYVCNLIEEDKLKDKQMTIFDVGE